MSRRMMLVPEDMYHGMIKLSSDSAKKKPVRIIGHVSAVDDDNIGLEHTEQRMSTVLKNNSNPSISTIKLKKKKRNKTRKTANIKKTTKIEKNAKISAQKTLYDQELRRYLLLRNQVKNKPVKVEIAPSGAKVIMKQNGPSVNAGVFNKDAEDFENFENPFASTNSMSSNGISEIPYKSDRSRNRKTSNTTHSQPTSTINDQNERRQRRTNIRPSLLEEIEQRKREFKTYVMAHMSKFPVNQQGNIISSRTGLPIQNSSLENSIDRLINPRLENMPSPSGTQELGSKAMKDPYLKQLILARFSTRMPHTDIYVPSPNRPKNLNELLNPRQPTTPFTRKRTFVNRGQNQANAQSNAALSSQQSSNGENYSFKPFVW